jgi:hypothetical protein
LSCCRTQDAGARLRFAMGEAMHALCGRVPGKALSERMQAVCVNRA